MSLNVQKERAGLERMTVGQLRDRYAEVQGEPTRSYHKEFLVRRIIWRMQAIEEGDLTERARKRAAELANDADLRVRAPAQLRLVGTNDGPTITKSLRVSADQRLPLPGSLLTRDYKGRRINVRVLPKGFEFEGEVYRSLSAIAQVVTGSHWNGWLFFGIKPAPNPNARAES
jgi:hypothetical protein